MSPQMIEYLATHDAHRHHYQPRSATGQRADLPRTPRSSGRSRQWARWSLSRRPA
jgi:hypothetical protein